MHKYLASLLVLGVLWFPCVPETQAQSTFLEWNIGAGQASCGAWREWQRIPRLRNEGIQWVCGFIIGSNGATLGPDVKPADAEAVAAYLDDYCARPGHAFKLIVQGAIALVQHLRAQDAPPARTK